MKKNWIKRGLMVGLVATMAFFEPLSIEAATTNDVIKKSEQEKENEKNNKKLDEDADFIDKLKEDLAEVEMQIEQEREYFHVDLSRRVSRFKNEKDRFISSIRQFYEQPYRLYNALNSKKDKVRVVWGDGFFYFNIQDFFEYEKEYKDYTNREEEAGSKQKSAEKKQSGRDTGSKQKGNTYKKERLVLMKKFGLDGKK